MSLPPVSRDVRVSLDMRLDGDGRPTGTVWPERGTPTTFVGWMSLMSELTSLIEASNPEQPNR